MKNSSAKSPSNRNLVFGVSPLAFLALSACGGSTTGGSGGGVSQFDGNLQNGPLANAFTFHDLHSPGTNTGDGVFDEVTEQGVRTDEFGNFSLSASDADVANGFTIVSITDELTIDTSTDTAYGAGFTFKAPQNSKVVSPNTTLVEKVLSSNSTLTEEQAVEKVAISMGISGVDFLNFDAYADESLMTDEEKEKAHSVKQANNTVMTVIKTFSAAANGSGLSEEDAFDVTFGALLDTVISGVVIDFSADSDQMEAFKTKLKTDAAVEAEETGVTLNEAQFEEVVNSAAKSVANVVTLIKATDKDSTEEELRDLFSTVSVVANEVLTTSAKVKSGEIEADTDAIEQSMTTATGIDAVTSKVDNKAPTDLKLTVNASEASSILENATSLVVGVMEVSDVTVGDTHTFAISGGEDADKFVIDAVTGALTILERPDYEVQKSYEVGVRVTDTGGVGKSYVEIFNIAVDDVNEAPKLTVPTNGSVTADVVGSTITGSLTGSDPENGALTYLMPGQTAVDGSYSVTGTYGTLVLNTSTGAYTYTLDNSATVVQALGPSSSETEAFSVQVTDDTNTTTAQDLSFSIKGSNDAPIGAVNISGTASQGEVLTAASTLEDAEGLGTLSYQWSEDDVAISGATSSTLTLGQSQVGKTITVDVSYTDGAGTYETVTSEVTSSVTNKNDAPTGAVTISGTATQGEELTAVSTLADADGLGTLAYQWSAGGDAISGATSSILTLGQSQVGKTITVAVNYTDGGGTGETVTSAATSSVVNVNDAPTGKVEITGSLVDGVLNAVSTLDDEDGIGSLEYQWQADGVDLSGENGSSFSIDTSDAGRSITVKVSYEDNGGTVETVSSEATTISLPPLFDVTIASQAESIVTFDFVTSPLADPSKDGIDSFEFVLTYDPNVFDYVDLNTATGVTAVPNATNAGIVSTAAFVFPSFTDLEETIFSVDLKILDSSAPSSISLSSLVTDNGNLESTHDFDFDFDNDLLIMSDIV